MVGTAAGEGRVVAEEQGASLEAPKGLVRGSTTPFSQPSGQTLHTGDLGESGAVLGAHVVGVDGVLGETVRPPHLLEEGQEHVEREQVRQGGARVFGVRHLVLLGVWRHWRLSCLTRGNKFST